MEEEDEEDEEDERVEEAEEEASAPQLQPSTLMRYVTAECFYPHRRTIQNQSASR